jgi:hypothetical protein
MKNVLSRSIVPILALMLALLTPGCSEVVPTTSHPAGDPAQVKIYTMAPFTKYEKLGLVTVAVTPEMKWDEKGDSTKGFEALFGKAAAMGGNAVLLQVDAGQYDTMVGAGYKGMFYNVPLRRNPKTIVAQALFVHSDDDKK